MKPDLKNPLRFISGYPDTLVDDVRRHLESGRMAPWLQERYAGRHDIQSDKALYRFVNDWRQRHLRHAPAIARVCYDSKLDVLKHALGLHTAHSKVHGGRLVASKEIRIAAVFRELPAGFLEMIVVHELAHLREMDHNKAFYQLCEHMLPGYAQREFDARVWLVCRELGVLAT